MQLHHFRQELADRRTQVFIIGFEKEERAREWRRRAQIDFPFLIDLKREVYRAYRIERSIFRAWHPRVLWFYTKRVFRGKGLPIFRADPSQLGADVLVSSEGIIRAVFASKDSMDRPSMDQLLIAIDDLDQFRRS